MMHGPPVEMDELPPGPISLEQIAREVRLGLITPQAAKALLEISKEQYKRGDPGGAGDSKGGTVSVKSLYEDAASE